MAATPQKQVVRGGSVSVLISASVMGKGRWPWIGQKVRVFSRHLFTYDVHFVCVPLELGVSVRVSTNPALTVALGDYPNFHSFALWISNLIACVSDRPT